MTPESEILDTEREESLFRSVLLRVQHYTGMRYAAWQNIVGDAIVFSRDRKVRMLMREERGEKMSGGKKWERLSVRSRFARRIVIIPNVVIYHKMKKYR